MSLVSCRSRTVSKSTWPFDNSIVCCQGLKLAVVGIPRQPACGGRGDAVVARGSYRGNLHGFGGVPRDANGKRVGVASSGTRLPFAPKGGGRPRPPCRGCSTRGPWCRGRKLNVRALSLREPFGQGTRPIAGDGRIYAPRSGSCCLGPVARLPRRRRRPCGFLGNCCWHRYGYSCTTRCA